MFPIKNVHDLPDLIQTCNRYQTNALANELGSSLSEPLVKAFKKNKWKPVDESIFSGETKLQEAKAHLINYGFLIALNIIGKKKSKKTKYYLCDISEFFTSVQLMNDIYSQEGYTLEVIVTQYYQQQAFDVC